MFPVDLHSPTPNLTITILIQFCSHFSPSAQSNQDVDSFPSSYIPTTSAIPKVVLPEDSQWFSFDSVVDESPRSGPEVVDSWISEDGDHDNSFNSFNEVPTTTENEQPRSPNPQVNQSSYNGRGMRSRV